MPEKCSGGLNRPSSHELYTKLATPGACLRRKLATRLPSEHCLTTAEIGLGMLSAQIRECSLNNTSLLRRIQGLYISSITANLIIHLTPPARFVHSLHPLLRAPPAPLLPPIIPLTNCRTALINSDPGQILHTACGHLWRRL